MGDSTWNYLKAESRRREGKTRPGEEGEKETEERETSRWRRVSWKTVFVLCRWVSSISPFRRSVGSLCRRELRAPTKWIAKCVFPPSPTYIEMRHISLADGTASMTLPWLSWMFLRWFHHKMRVAVCTWCMRIYIYLSMRVL